MHLPSTLPAEIILVLPDQLFRNHPGISKNSTVILVEEYLWFRQFRFHIARLLHSRVAMQGYSKTLQSKVSSVFYLETTNSYSDIRLLIPQLKLKGVKRIVLAEVCDDWFNQRLDLACKEQSIEIQRLPSPAFLNRADEYQDLPLRQGRLYQTSFYISQRKRFNLLMEGDKPAGKQWSFDAENRKKLPAKFQVPKPEWPKYEGVIQKQAQTLRREFPDNPGHLGFFEKEDCFYPSTHEQAEAWLQSFLEHRFYNFGVYEDALSQKHPIVFHSLISPLVNSGLLLPQEVLDTCLEFALEHQIPLNSVEGFVRQIIGWREFVRLVYLRNGRAQRTTNFFRFSRKIPEAFWKGQTGWIPIDHCISKVQDFAYLHHIERLMVIGNYLLLIETDPNEVYDWFMSMFIDSYDWVMVPNVYGMSQYADGGMMTTKPYISGSNYLLKMSDFPKGEWTEIWDALFWRFVLTYPEVFGTNPRTSILLSNWAKRDKSEQNRLLRLADNYLAGLGT
jgi:deoxyribodipyrimidine photolyase-related protein